VPHFEHQNPKDQVSACTINDHTLSRFRVESRGIDGKRSTPKNPYDHTRD